MLEAEIMGMLCAHMMGRAARASLEQLVPTTAASFGSAASFVAAVWPPSALHSVSSPISSILWPRRVPPRSSMATSTPNLVSVPSDASEPETTIM